MVKGTMNQPPSARCSTSSAARRPASPINSASCCSLSIAIPCPRSNAWNASEAIERSEASFSSSSRACLFKQTKSGPHDFAGTGEAPRGHQLVDKLVVVSVRLTLRVGMLAFLQNPLSLKFTETGKNCQYYNVLEL